MKVASLRDMQIKSLRLPGDFPKRVEREKVREKTRSIGEHGLIRPAMVRQGTLEVIVGVDDIAALVALKKTHVRCEMVECTDEEVKILRVQARLQYEQMSADERHTLRGEYLLLLEQQEKRHALDERIRDPEKDGRGFGARQVTYRAKQRLAEKLGITVAALAKQEYRARKKLKEKGDIEATVPMRRFGMELTEEFEERLASAKKGMLKLAGQGQAALRTLSAMRQAKLDMPDKQVGRAEAMLSEFCQYIRNWTPVGLCPYCKGLPKVCPKCLSCGGSAMLFKIQENGVLPELLDTKNPMVYVDGEFKPVGLFAEEAKEGVDVRLVEETNEHSNGISHNRDDGGDSLEGMGDPQDSGHERAAEDTASVDPWGLGE